MKLKNLLFENISEELVRRVRKDCSTFIQKNKQTLRNGDYLMRGTAKKYDGKQIVSKQPRKRKEVKGQTFKTWVYEHFKPQNYPSREDMVPSQFKKLEGTFDTLNTFTVFPIGKSYKLHYTSNVTDFNSFNPYIEHIFDPVALLQQALKDGNIPDELEKDGRDAMDDYMDKISSDYEDVRVAYNEVWEVINKMAPHDEGLKEGLDELKNGIERFFQESSFTQKLPETDQPLEVNIYAPQGWYYAKKSIASKEIV